MSNPVDATWVSTTIEWSRRRHTAMLVEQAARAIHLRPGSDTVTGAQSLIDALDAYWQARYGGRVVVVAGPEGER